MGITRRKLISGGAAAALSTYLPTRVSAQTPAKTSNHKVVNYRP